MVFIAMRILAQTSFKTELWLKSYKSLKFQGLDCKISNTTRKRLIYQSQYIGNEEPEILSFFTSS
jgi:hypothetical protein